MSKKRKTAEKSQPENTPVVYCGPTIKGITKQYTVYTNGLPEEIKRLIDKCKILSALIVPITELARVKKALADPDSSESIFYDKAVQILIKGGN